MASGQLKQPKIRSKTLSLRERLKCNVPQEEECERDLLEEIKLPAGSYVGTWVAANVFDFYAALDRIWAELRKSDVEDDFALYSPGQGYPKGVQYYWPSPTNGEEAELLPAPDYVNNVLGWVRHELESLPELDDSEQALARLRQPQFAIMCGQILRRLFRVFAIILVSFERNLEALEGMKKAHATFCFQHFVYFCTEFGLLPEQEVDPVKYLVNPIRAHFYADKRKRAAIQFKSGIQSSGS